MDANSLHQLAAYIWPLLAAGATQRAGEIGTERVLEGAQELVGKVRSSRREAGKPDDPESLEELRKDLEKLISSDARSSQIAVTVFQEKVKIKGTANFGISNQSV